jgi:hypothetical protein
LDSISDIYIGSNKLNFGPLGIAGNIVELEGEMYYQIENYDQMRPFFMSLTSDSDIWMFISSDGGLTAGRKTADHAIFPYYTDDQLSLQSENTGSKSIFHIKSGNKWQLWLPFSDKYMNVYQIQRSLYKNAAGNKLIFEEINMDLGLKYRYSWLNASKYGIIKRSELINLDDQKKMIRLLDGLENLLPPGIIQLVQQTKSNLSNAYKKNEYLPESGMGVYCLSSNIIDRPEPSEALRATTVWSAGLEGSTNLLSSKQIDRFITGQTVEDELNIRAEPGAYLSSNQIELEGTAARSWYFVADTDQSAVQITALEHETLRSENPLKLLEKEIEESNRNLQNIISQGDGLQISSNIPGNMRHLSNTMFNVMRGGIYSNGYIINKDDFIDFLSSKNEPLLVKYSGIIEELPDEFTVSELKTEFQKGSDVELQRFAFEYLPITFSRRHGDPSRPWNKFNIDVIKEDGTWKKSYEGNWRDIFQNWEALSYTYPEFIENIIILFLNATTIDGYNPYRISNKGIEWEITDPSDPWSFIGYWGDHQIIYLLKLLEISIKFNPGIIEDFLDKPFFTFANVPYRIKRYQDIVNNPHDTITYDELEEKRIQKRIRDVGSDGKLIWNEGQLLMASLTEKLFIPLLTKLSNFVPEGGIWMNTQRPEWNDANNALVGHGLSMVTVYYIHRYLEFLKDFYGKQDLPEFEISQESGIFFESVHKVFNQFSKDLDKGFTDQIRKEITDALGLTGETYRTQVYGRISGRKVKIRHKHIMEFIDLVISFTRQSIRANRRKDSLYHAYNLITLSKSGYGIEYLYPMLEGQVAVLSSGYIDPQEALGILSSLRESDLYREDQDSYLLYPDRQLVSFMDKSSIDVKMLQKSGLLKRLLEVGDQTIIQQDTEGNLYFNPEICNADDLRSAMARLEDPAITELIQEEEGTVLEIYEEVFNHHSFTGRSGKFFGYEGLGSIYWHMNSKLLLAVQEIYYKALNENEPDQVMEDLKTFYYDIKEGLGTMKNPGVYGAFPTDPYSHTPAHKGAQQPGMTGQVKEDILSRIGELGISVQDGCIEFNNSLLDPDEFLRDPARFEYFDLHKHKEQLKLPEGSLAFLFCQVPIVYTLSESPGIQVQYNDGSSKKIEGSRLPESVSRKIFSREGSIRSIKVQFGKE